MTTHHPGPWHVGNCGAVIADPMPTTSRHDVAHFGGEPIAQMVAPQNQLLIAAAPTMHRTLQKLRYALDAGMSIEAGSMMSTHIDAALARVAGRLVEARVPSGPSAQQRLTFALAVLDMLASTNKIARIGTHIARSNGSVPDVPKTGDPLADMAIKRAAKEAGFVVPEDPMPAHLDEYIEKLEAADR